MIGMQLYSMVLFLLSFLLSLSLWVSNVSAAQIDLNGRAYDIDTKQPIYAEQHRVIEESGQHVMQSQYFDNDNKQIAVRKVVFENDLVSEYKLEQDHIAYQESIIRTDNGVDITTENKSNIKQKSVALKNPKAVVIDAGFSNFITRNWQQLMKGETLKFKFASASQMKAVMLQIKFVNNADGLVFFTMTAANPLFKLLMTPIEIGYNENSKHLAYYKGVSNLQDTKGDYYDVEIHYSSTEDAKNGHGSGSSSSPSSLLHP